MNTNVLAVIISLSFFVLWVFYPNYPIPEQNQTIYMIGGAALLYQLFNVKNETTEEAEEELGEEEEEEQLPH